jgi:(p)ppGpp synthase/HD superfamily hydrolase
MRLAAAAHDGQLDKAGSPYINHPRRVMARLLLRWPDAPIDELHAALLHDVVEDAGAEFTIERLRAEGYTETVISILQLVTRDADRDTYSSFIERIATSGNIGAMRVKLADLADNLDPARIARLPPGSSDRTSGYEAATRRLEEAMNGLS